MVIVCMNKRNLDSDLHPRAVLTRMIARILQAPIVSGFADLTSDLDWSEVIIVNCFTVGVDYEFLEAVGLLISYKTKRFVWIMNDYTSRLPHQILKHARPTDVWSTIEGFSEYLNWNVLVYRPENFIRTDWDTRGLFYYGQYRQQRERMYDKYFSTDLYDVHVSSSNRGQKKFSLIDYRIRLYPTTNTRLLPSMLSLYIRDSNIDFYQSPSNRFYECLGQGVPMVFDKDCVPDLRGYDISPYIVDGPQDVEIFLKKNSLPEIVSRQASWRKDFLGEFESNLRRLLNEYFDSN